MIIDHYANLKYTFVIVVLPPANYLKNWLKKKFQTDKFDVLRGRLLEIITTSKSFKLIKQFVSSFKLKKSFKLIEQHILNLINNPARNTVKYGIMMIIRLPLKFVAFVILLFGN